MHSHSQGPWVSHTTEAGEVIRLTGWKGTHSSTWALPSTYGLDRESGGACRSPPPWSQWSDCYVAHHYPIHLSVNWQKAGGPQPGCKCKSSGGLGTSSTADSWAGPAQMSPGRTGQTFWEQNSRSNPRSKLRVSLRSTTKRPQAPWEGGKERREETGQDLCWNVMNSHGNGNLRGQLLIQKVFQREGYAYQRNTHWKHHQTSKGRV